MPVAETHPSADELAAFTLGTLDDEAQASIEVHVAACTSCQERAAVAPGDSLVELLRRIDARTSRGADTFVDAAAQVQTPVSFTPVVGTEALAAAVAPATGAESDRLGMPDAIPPELAHHERYRVVRLLGSGGMGAVYEAEHRVMQRLVALKVINRAYTANAAARDRFRREVRAAARLTHPNVVTTYDAEDAGETHFLVMEYVEGTDLGRLLQEHGPLPVDRACEYARQAALGLQHAFEQGMVHRDVKPHNLMRTPDGRVKILDFGLAFFASEAAATAGRTASGIVLGTVDYIAPEQADNAHEADIRADIYSLGCTLYHLLAGRPPFPMGTPLQKLAAHVNKNPQPLTELRDDLPEGLMSVLERMTAKNPRDRYQTPAEVAIALEPFTVATAVARKCEPHPRASKARHSRTLVLETSPAYRPRWRGIVALAALLFITAAAGVVVLRIQTDNGELVITTESPDVEVIVKGDGKVVRVIDTKTDKEVRLTLRSGTYELELKGAPEGLKLSLDKATLTRGETVLAKIVRVEVEKGAAAGKATEVQRFEGEQGHFYAISPDDRLLAAAGTATGPGWVQLWDVTTGKKLHRLNGHTGNVQAVAFSPDGKWLVSGSGGPGNTVWIWEVETGKAKRTWRHAEPGRTGWVTGVAFAPDGKTVFSSEIDGTVRMCDVEADKELKRFGGKEPYRCLAISPDGRLIACGTAASTTPRDIFVWDVQSGKEVQHFEGHKSPGKEAGEVRIYFSPDGKRLLTGGYDNTARVWDVASGKEVWRVNCERAGFPGGVRWAPDGRTVWGVRSDFRALQRWDAETGKELPALADPQIFDRATVAFLLGDGRFVLCLFADKTARLWRLPDLPPVKDRP
jgi:WD40 repeat protein